MTAIKRIVCIDDDENILAVNKLLIEGIGHYEVKGFTSGTVAIEYMKTAKPDLILLDMAMPDMDGLEVLKLLRHEPKTSTIPVIFMTAKKNAADVKKYMDMGALSVITKPIDVEDFPHQIEMLSQIVF